MLWSFGRTYTYKNGSFIWPAVMCEFPPMEFCPKTRVSPLEIVINTNGKNGCEGFYARNVAETGNT